ncbi:Cytosolic Fe-S cluster assembly factor nar1, partial [Ascosphaera pollenicola]
MANAVLSSAESTSTTNFWLELIWQESVRELRRNNNEIHIPFQALEGDVLGSQPLEDIKTRLSLGTPTISIEDKSKRIWRICAVPAVEDHGDFGSLKADRDSKRGSISSVSSKAVKRQKIPRPPNAFILYRQHYHPIIKAKHPDFHNNDISILLGKQWKAESVETKAEFKAMAEDIKRKHAEEYPNYQYAPRKPSERKRRSSARRNALNERASSSGGVADPPSLPQVAEITCESAFDGFGDVSYRVTNQDDARLSYEAYPFTPGIAGADLLPDYGDQT